MFLFTTPDTPQAAKATSPVVDAIRQGARASGADFEYLLATAQRESSLDPAARARTSSATGLFQFIEQTWLGMVKKEGAKIGLSEEARAITQRPDGGFTVADPAMRRDILALREDPKIASTIAGSFTQYNREFLSSQLQREPRPADLYIAHFLGAAGAAELIRQAGSNPQLPAAELFPEAAAANRSIFNDRAGAARGAGEVYGLLASYHATTASTSVGNATAQAEHAGFPQIPLAKTDGPAFHGLFQTAGRQGAISDAVSRLWSIRSEEGTEGPRASFFPGSGRPDAAAETAGVAPLPPTRPRDAPLDLNGFMHWRRSL